MKTIALAAAVAASPTIIAAPAITGSNVPFGLEPQFEINGLTSGRSCGFA